MTYEATVRLLEIEPDLARFLSNEDRADARSLSVPVRVVAKGVADMDGALRRENAFGAVVLDGMLLQRLQLADQITLRLMGPGDLVTLSGVSKSMLLVDSGARAAANTHLALLGDEMLLAARRWPQLVAGLHVRLGEQADRLATQLAICQLPRVGDRLLAIMWLLAESWGQVTASGTTLPVALTHEALGALIGARRPTVTIALGELIERGAIVRQDRGWLLLEGPPQPAQPVPRIEEPELVEEQPSEWAIARPAASPKQTYAGLAETVVRLHEDHLRNRERVRRWLNQMERSRERATELRRRIMLDRVRRHGLHHQDRS